MGSTVFTDRQMQDPTICRGVAISDLERIMTDKTVMAALISPENAASLNCIKSGDKLHDFMADMEGGAEVQMIALSTSGWLALLVEPLPASTCDPIQLVHLSAYIRRIHFSEMHYPK